MVVSRVRELLKNVVRRTFAVVAKSPRFERRLLALVANRAAKTRREQFAPEPQLNVDLLTLLLERSLIFQIPSNTGERSYGVLETRLDELNAEIIRNNLGKINSRRKSDQYLLRDQEGRLQLEFNIWFELESGEYRTSRWNPRATVISGELDNVQSWCDSGPIWTHPDLASPGIDDCEHPIDIVYLWVDGSDVAWQARRLAASAGDAEDISEHSHSESRFRQFDELRYSFRSLQNIPWIRNIYVVTDNQVPSWLDRDGDRVRIIDHTEILPPECLPTINSHAITANLHRIPGLGEHFLYLNDDLLVARHLPKVTWFSSNGTALVRYTRTLQPGASTIPENEVIYARRNTIQLAQHEGLVTTPRSLFHAPHPLRKSVIEEMWQKFPEELRRTTAAQFRSSTDIVPEWLHNFVGLTSGKVAIGRSLSYKYLALNARSTLMAIVGMLWRKTSPVLICLNDSSEVADGQNVHSSALEYRVRSIGRGLFPSASRFELDVIEAETQSGQ